MPSQSLNQTQQQTSTTHPLSTDGILQRQCLTCGQHTIAGDTCPECEKQQSLLERSPSTSQTIAVPPVPPTPTGGFNHDISRVPVRRSSLRSPIQAKLTVGEPGDKYEQEADQVADQIMKMPDPALSGGKTLTQPTYPLAIQRITPVNGENLRRQYEAKEEDEDEGKKPIQAKEMAASSLQLSSAAPAEKLQRQPMKIDKDEEDEEEKLSGTVQTKALPGFSIQPVTSMAEGTLQRQNQEDAEERLRDEDEEEEKPLQAKEMPSSPLQLSSAVPAQMLQRQPIEMEKDEEDEEEKAGETLQTKTLPGFSIQPVNSMADGTLQRQDEEDVEEQEEEEEENQQVQAKEQPGRTPKVTPTLEARLNKSQGQGKPLSEETRGFMESRFGRDLSQVRVHTDGEAAELNRDLRAQAFTHGQNVYFGTGKYGPETGDGKRLLAHELTHVVQQNSQSGNFLIQREEFGEQIRFDSLPEPPPRARLLGPYRDSAIAEELYGDPSIPIIYTPEDPGIIQISYDRLLNRWKSYFPESIQENAPLRISLPLEDAEIYVLPVDDQGNPITAFGSTQLGTEPTFLESGLTGLRPGLTTGGAQSLGYLLAPPIRSRLDPLLPLMSRTGDISSPLGRQGSHFILERYAGRGRHLLDELVPRYRGREGSALRALEYSYRPGMQLSATNAELARWFTRYGLRTRDLEALPSLLARVESGGLSSLTVAEQQILLNAVRAHAEFGQVRGSPFLSATRQSGLSGLQGRGTNPTFLQGRQYIVRVRVPASTVADANALVPRSQGHRLAHELEMLVATDARGNIQSVRPNPTSALGRAAPWIRVGGRVVFVAGLAYSGYRIGTATPEERPRVVGEEIGGNVGGFGGAALGAGACIAFGIASGGIGLLLCGLGGALIGGGVGTAVGGAIGESSTRTRSYRTPWDNPNKVCCFLGQVVVTTSSGTQRIDQVKPGDKVISLNPDNGQIEERKVINLEIHQGEFSLLELYTGKDSIIVTTRHFFGENSGGWISSEQIRPNCELVGLDGSINVQRTSKLYQWHGTVYNLKVDGGNYFVGNQPVLVRDY